MVEADTGSPKTYPPLFVVSGGYGTSGSQLAHTAIAQFSGFDIPVIVVPHVRRKRQIEDVVRQASAAKGTILHTLVDARQRAHLVELARSRNVVTIDLIGTVLARLTTQLGAEPAGQPGLYRQLREDYFKRVEAIEFTVAHDDGKRIQDLPKAEIVLVGPSRVGKTPLSMYLSVSGWRVSNVPLAVRIPAPLELFEIDRRRVVGLTIDPAQLQAHRRRRIKSLGSFSNSNYTTFDLIEAELEHAHLVFRRGGFPAVNVTDRPLEETADDVVSLVKSRLG